MVEINRCTHKNLCVDCNDPDCLLAGDIEADCPKWKCDNPSMDCENCEFLKEYKKEGEQMRYCKIKGKFCIYATEHGYCSFTVCREVTE